MNITRNKILEYFKIPVIVLYKKIELHCLTDKKYLSEILCNILPKISFELKS